MAERLPLLHIVGVPSTTLQGKEAILHRSPLPPLPVSAPTRLDCARD